ncbi:hypothetical protein RJ639_008368 [Escallonia herrerae]|uniref:Reverse transcriptase RNase H-like domain-containing protein n=1 Tax=Escallonia herrerae TaxID=1293975 RepID=A0AA88VUC6_9ASTE|nr:hypothetical protein RJ639_008368 [Escallonia herrerae]
MARGVRPSMPLHFSLNKHPPENMSDLLNRVEKYLRVEEDSTTSQHEETHTGHRRQDRLEGENLNESKRSRATLPKMFTPLNTSWGHILNQIKSQSILKWPKPMRGPAEKRDSQLYCHFHKDHRHTTDECKTKATTSLEFDDTDLDRISLPYDDALVISLRIDAFQVKRILVDTGSSADIIFEDVFNQMLISDDRVKAISSPLYGFTVHTLDFLIVKVKSSYNRILGRTRLNKLQAVASTYHLVMKFPTPTGVGFVKGDQTLARRCYVASCRAKETLSIDDQHDEKALRRAEPVEALISIPLIEGDNEWQVRIGSTLEPTIRKWLISFLISNMDIFVWSAADMPASPPLLSKRVIGEDLFLYLAVAESAVSAVLVREQDGQQLPVYYVSKVLQGAMRRYPNAKKLAFALLTAARELRPYFQSHTIIMLTDKPLRWILHRPDLSGHLVPWSVELGEFDICYRPRPLIKGQALANFIIECTLPIEVEAPLLKVEEPLLPVQSGSFTWTLFVDGSSNASGSGAGLILNGPDGLTVEYALRFDF